MTTDEFLTAHYGKLLNYAHRFTRKSEDAEDLVQETALRIVKYWHQCTDKDQASTWAHSILRNVYFDRCRKLKTRPEGHLIDVGTPSLVARSHEAEIVARLTIVRVSARLTRSARQALSLILAGEEPDKLNATQKTHRFRLRQQLGRRLLRQQTFSSFIH